MCVGTTADGASFHAEEWSGECELAQRGPKRRGSAAGARAYMRWAWSRTNADLHHKLARIARCPVVKNASSTGSASGGPTSSSLTAPIPSSRLKGPAVDTGYGRPSQKPTCRTRIQYGRDDVWKDEGSDPIVRLGDDKCAPDLT
ncbi:hypothetical protein F5148DRAFT_1152914 [Russula earlei]|uniref:Uncharacterized protein n=1 Tax=Russula earlei TaxID=71964 RepID=A0ACC0TX85_9AGAM|nr:hypothetical protein F5148DRAFT_1152914 [Russula earlei]